MSGTELRVAIVGARGHQSALPAIGPTTATRIVAVASDGAEDAKGLLSNPAAQGARYFDNYEKMLDEVRPDLVLNGSQPARCGPIVLAALRRGIHIISDKPIANSREELDQMRAVLRANPKLHLLTEFTMRIQKPWLAMRQAVRDGRIGEVALIQAQKSYRFGGSRPDYYKTRAGYPGTIMFIGSHIIDLAYWITGLTYVEVRGALHGNMGHRDYGQFEDHAAALFRLKNGASAVMHMDYLRPAAAPTHGDDRMRIAGTRGVVEVRDERCMLITNEQPPTEIGGGPPDKMVAALELIETIRGRGKGVFSTADSLYIAGVLLAAREAADTGKTVRLE